LDDNRLLTMPNGERIQFANNINFLFECHSLEFASPATVSRCGMLFLSDEAVDLQRLAARWLATYTGAADKGACVRACVCCGLSMLMEDAATAAR
jgi:dynein heavy chain 2